MRILADIHVNLIFYSCGHCLHGDARRFEEVAQALEHFHKYCGAGWYPAADWQSAWPAKRNRATRLPIGRRLTNLPHSNCENALACKRFLGTIRLDCWTRLQPVQLESLKRNLIPEHFAAGFVMVPFPEYPHKPGPTTKEPMFEFHFRARRGNRMSERHAEPIRGNVDEFASNRRNPGLLIETYFALTKDAEIPSAIADRQFPARVRKRNTGEVEMGCILLLFNHVRNFPLIRQRPQYRAERRTNQD